MRLRSTCSHFAKILFICWLVIFGYQAQAQVPDVTVRFANPTYNCVTEAYCLDVEFQTNLENVELFGMNVRFFYDDSQLELIGFSDFQGGYLPVAPNPPDILTSPPAAGPALFNFTGAAEFINGAIQLVDDMQPPIYISTTDWTKLFQICFTIDDPGMMGEDFCPPVVWDLEVDPANGGFLVGDDGVVITVVDPDPNVDSGPANEFVVQFNWQYSGDGTPPYGEPIETDCISLDCMPVITCPTDLTLDCLASTHPDATGYAMATEPCLADVTITYDDEIVPGDCPFEYTIQRTWTATNECDLSDFCVQTISVEDNDPPTLICPPSVTIECTASTLPANTGLATATDVCDSAPLVEYSDMTLAGDCPQEYTITRTWTATDICGNSTACIQTITVDDSMPPMVTCPPNMTIECTESTLPAMTGTATATDLCDPNPMVTYADMTLAGACPQEYTITRTWTATDACGNATNCIQIITVDDSMAPAITCPANITIECMESTLPDNTGEATATDLCDPDPTVTYSDVTAAGSCPQEYTITRTWTASDACGNSTSCTQTINIEDSMAPMITCPEDITIECTESTLPGNTGSATATDLCDPNPVVMYTDMTVAGACPQAYTINRTWTATDACGNTALCTQSIEIRDTQAPMITCPANTTIECPAVPSFAPPMVSDLCDPLVDVTFSDETIPTDCPSEYTVVRTWIATDDCGSSSSCTTSVTVVDNTPPVIPMDGEADVQCVEDAVPPVPPIGQDACDGAIQPVLESVMDLAPGGIILTQNWTNINMITVDHDWSGVPNIIGYRGDNLTGGTGTDPQTILADGSSTPVNVIANQTNPNTLATGGVAEFHIANPVVALNGSGTADAPHIVISINTECFAGIQVSYNVRDLDGSIDNAIQQVALQYRIGNSGNYINIPAGYIADATTGPNLAVLVTPVNVTLPVACNNQPLVQLRIMTTNAVGNDEWVGIDDIEILGMSNICGGSLACGGVRKYTYLYEDCAGNQSRWNYTYNIDDTIAPSITCPANTTIECMESTLPGNTGMATATDNCDPNPVVTYNDVTMASTVCAQEYTITRTWTATDECGNSTACIQTITVDDSMAPEITCPDDVTIECTDSTLPDNTGMATATDNCDPNPMVTYTDATVAGECAQEYIIQRTWTATDACGNANTCLQIITIEDSTPPMVTCPADVTIECTDSTLPDNTGLATATDNCDPNPMVAYTDATIAGECAQEYRIERTWTATDVCGNSTSCVQQIDIRDTQAPVIQCPAHITVSCDAISTLYSVAQGDNLLRQIDPQTAATLGSVPMSLVGFTIQGGLGLTTHPVTQELYVILRVTGPRRLATVDPLTGVCTDIGPLGDNFANIAFNGDGSVLWGVTGDGATVPETLYEIDQTDASSTFLCGLGNGTDGEVIAYNSSDGGLYHASGHTGNDVIFEVITDIGVDPCSVSNIDISGSLLEDEEAQALVWWPSQGVFLWKQDHGTGPLYRVTTSGVPTLVGGMDHQAKGLAFVGDGGAVSPAITGYATASDLCDPDVDVTYSDVITEGVCANEFTVTRTWVATDACGNSSSCTQIITVEDSSAPAITCPEDVTLECTDSTLPDNTGMATATDNCDANPMVTYSDATVAGECAQEYTITRTWTATDACGNSTACVQIITIDDSMAPELTCPADMTIECTDSTLPDNTGMATATDNCDPNPMVAYTDATIAGECAQEYTITRTWTATDACGNSTACIQIITVDDSTLPLISCPADVTIECTDSTSPDSLGEASATDNCDDAPIVEYTDVTIGSELCPQNYTIERTWTATDACGNSTACVQRITIEDSTPPFLLCSDDVTMECDMPLHPEYTGYPFVLDNCDPEPAVDYTDVTLAGECGPEYRIERTWTATDACGNVSTCLQIIDVLDTTAPEIVCPDDLTLECSDILPTDLATATDNCSDNLIIGYTDVVCDNPIMGFTDVYDFSFWTITIPPQGGSVSTMSDNEVMLVSPNEGNCPQGGAAVLLSITVPGTGHIVFDWNYTTMDVDGPAFDPFGYNLNGTFYQLTNNNGADTQNGSVSVAVMAGDIFAFEQRATDCVLGAGATTVVEFFACIEQEEPVCTQLVIRTHTAEDECGNVGSCVQTILIVDTTAPEVTCAADITIECTESTLPDNTGLTTATDNCDPDLTVNYTDVTIAGECAQEYRIERTWTATDVCGNSASCLQIITVDDSAAPLVSCPADVTIECTDSTLPEYTGMMTATDNCDPNPAVTYVDVTFEGECAQEYTIERTWTATDACGNSTACTQIITVDDSTPPVCLTQDITLSEIIDPDTGYIVITAEMIDNGSFDNCGDVTLSVSPDTLYCVDEGVAIVVLTVTDECGNISTCTAQVTFDCIDPCVKVNTWVYLEGSAVDPNGFPTYMVPMRTTLNDLHILPGQVLVDPFFGPKYSPAGQPYIIAPWNYPGTEGDGFDSGGDPMMGDAGYPSTVVDWVLVSIRADSAGTGGPVCQAAALLHSSGWVEFVQEFDCCDLDLYATYFLVIEHRNHLIVMSHDSLYIDIDMDSTTLNYDFRMQQSYIDDPFNFGIFSGQKLILNGIYAMFAGNGNQTLSPQSDTDINFDDRTFWEMENGFLGEYRIGDYNMNGDTNFNDRVQWERNNGRFTSVPRD